MRQVNLKKYVLPNLPYLFVGLYATKLGQAWRLSSGMEFADKVLHLMDGFATAFQSAAPSFHPSDLLVGLCCGAGLRLAVYIKGKNAKKYRHGTEYGSARWGTAKDIQPFVDPVFENNAILTQTEQITMNNRPKDPKTARNKNFLIIGGSGSGLFRCGSLFGCFGFVAAAREHRRSGAGQDQLQSSTLLHHWRTPKTKIRTMNWDRYLSTRLKSRTCISICGPNDERQ